MKTFNDYLKSQIDETSANKHRPNNVSFFSDYVNWLVYEQKTHQATVAELIAQIVAISAHIQREPSGDVSEEQMSRVYALVNTYFDEAIKEIDSNIASASRDYFYYLVTCRVVSLLAFAAICIGSSFAPNISSGIAIALWAISSLSALSVVSHLYMALTADTSTPEVRVWGRDMVALRNDQDYLDAKLEAVDKTLREFEHDSWFNPKSPAIRTAKAISDIIDPSERTRAYTDSHFYPGKSTSINIHDTLIQGTRTLYINKYQFIPRFGEIGLGIVYSEPSACKNGQQPVMLSYLTSRLR